MGKNIEHIQHLRSNEVVNGQPKAPAANNLLDGEIAVNYAAGNETLFIKSSDGSNVKSFSNDDNFYKKGAIDDIVSGINDTISGLSGDTQSEIDALDEKKFDASGITGYTTTAATKALNDVVTAHTGDATVHFTTGAVQTQIDDSISGKCDTSAFTAHTSSTVHMNATEKTNLDSLATNIGAISGITAQKVTNWDNAYADRHTHSNKTALDSITGNVGTMAYANESSYSSATQVNTALAGKSNTGHTHHSNEVDDMSGYTKPSSTSAIATGDTLNQAIGKLEKAIDGLQPGGSYVEMSAFTAHTSSTVHMNATEKTHLDSLAANIGVISGITAQKVTNWDNASTNSHTHSNKTALDSITGNVGTMAYADTSNYSSATQVNTALAGKSNTGHTHHSNEVGDMSGYTKPTSTSAIVTGDTLNAAIGKLEKAIDGRQPVGSYVETSTYTSYTSTTQSTINSKANSSTTVSSADYYVSGTTHQLRFKDVAGNVISTVDAGEFIKDGMIDTVEIQTVPYSGESQPCLVITWNTDAGKDVTYIPIKNIFNPNEYVPTGRTITTASGLTGGGNLGSNRTIGLEATGTAGTYYVANTDAYGRVTGGTTTVPYSSATQVNTALAKKSDTGHTHYSNEVTAMSGYSKPSSTSAIVTGDTLNAAVGKLESGLDGKLNKTTYEWNKEIAFGSSGYLLIGKFPMYDSNITVEIDSTDSSTYHGTLVIATQNINTSRGGSFVCNVYGDATNTVTDRLRVQYSSGSNKFNVYFQPNGWSKNLIHIKACALAGAPTESEICSYVDSVPTTDLVTINNVLPANYLPLSGGSMTGSITMNQSATARNVGIVGTYDYTKAAAIWAMGSSYQIPADGSSLGSLYGAAYVYQGQAGQGTMAGEHQFVWAQGGFAYVALGNYVWARNGFQKSGSTDSYVLLGGGGHAAISGLSVNHASTADTSTDCSKLNGLTIIKITRAAYNALATKDPNTLYVISD